MAAAAVALAATISFPQSGVAGDSPILPDLSSTASLKDRLFFFGGADVAKDSYFTWSGLVGAPTGLLHEDGFRFRLAGGLGRYRYQTDAVPGRINEGYVSSGEVMAGYRREFGPVAVTAFVGLHAENQRLSKPDLGHEAQGTEFGVKGAIETYARLNDWIAASSAAASTVHHRFHARASIAREHPSGIALGLEALIHGDARYREPRAGIFAHATFRRTVVTLAGGVLDNSDRGTGAYATLSIYAPY